MQEPQFWRMRMTVAGSFDRSSLAWDRGEVGLWYGAWSSDDWIAACQANKRDPWSVLKELPHQIALGWNFTPDMGAMKRFEAIKLDDWVVVYLRDRGEIGLAQLEQEVRSEADHPVNQKYSSPVSTELFKYRRATKRKTFRIVDLPDTYRLLPAQGRQSNVHQFHGMRPHVSLLAACEDEQAVRLALDKMPFDKLIDFLGASAWESVCTAFLTLEHGFVPTGLKTGSTLPTFDIVGRRMPDGMPIVAQCKKHPYPVEVEPDFLAALQEYVGPRLAFYFAYFGCLGIVPKEVIVVSRTTILEWVESETGNIYRQFLQGR